MGKKRKIISKPQKFGRKHSSHPLAKPVAQLEESAPELKPEPVVEETKPEPKPEPKKIEVKKEEPRRRTRKTSADIKKTKPAKD